MPVPTNRIKMMNYLNTLNEEQRHAVTTTQGPLLVLAGAGSGKTRVITYRILYLINEKHVSPRHILGITFTNKASNEMQERINKLANKPIKGLTISTFHSFGVRILKKHIHHLGYKPNFNIYDENDKKNLIKSILNEMHLDSLEFNLNVISKQISLAKNMHLFLKYFDQLQNEEYKIIVKDIYKRYEENLKHCNSLDFDDLIILPITLLKKFPEIQKEYQKQYQYILVDEYQDTNNIQYQFIKKLLNPQNNICVVGDDDQAIYGFRGSSIEHILRFEKDFPNTIVITLTKNYRSSKNILLAAGSIIKNNTQRHIKSINPTKKLGEKILIRETDDEMKEAEFVINKMNDLHYNHKIQWKEMAILYRTNFQSRPFEEVLRFKNIPYKIIGGIEFYDRKEIKDILAYLKVIANEKDELSLLRILNYPKRGIGDKTIYELNQYSMKNKLSLYETLAQIDKIDSIKSTLKNIINNFVDVINRYKKEFFHTKKPMYKIAYDLVEEIQYEDELKNESDEMLAVKRKMYNISELISSIRNYEESAKETDEKPNLYNYLNKISLLTREEETNNGEENKVSLMTLHLSKGLEFQTVFIVGMENDLLPHLKTLEEGNSIEEERRLFYVGMTRAKENLIITYAKNRKKFGTPLDKEPSQFIGEIPEGYCMTTDEKSNNEKERSVETITKIKEMLTNKKGR